MYVTMKMVGDGIVNNEHRRATERSLPSAQRVHYIKGEVARGNSSGITCRVPSALSTINEV